MNELIWVVQINDQTSAPLKSITTQVDAFIRSVQSGVNDLGKVFDIFNTYMDQAIAKTLTFTGHLRSAFDVPTPRMPVFQEPGAAPAAPTGAPVAEQAVPAAAPDITFFSDEELARQEAITEGLGDFEEANERVNESIRKQGGLLSKTARFFGKFFGIEKKVTTETNKNDTANKKAAGSLRQLSAAALAASGRLGQMAGQVQDNALGLEQLGISWSKVFSVMRKLSIGYIILSLAKAGLNAALRIKDMNAQLYMTIQQSKAVAGVIDQVRQQAVALGLSIDELKGIVQTGVQVSFLNRTVAEGRKVLQEYTKATLETAQATGASAESIGQLYQRIIGVGAIADVGKLRNIGAGIKFIADQSMLSADEVIALTGSLENMFRMGTQGMGRAQTEITGDIQAIAGALATYIKPEAVAGLFTGLKREIESDFIDDITRAFSDATSQSIPVIQRRFREGDVTGLMEDFVGGLNKRSGPQLRAFAALWGGAVDMSLDELLRLRNFDVGMIGDLVERQREILRKGELQNEAAAARQNRLTRAWNQAQDALATLWEEQGMRVVDILNQHLIPAIEWLIVKIQDLRKWWNGLSEEVQLSYVKWGAAGLALFAFSEKIVLVIGSIVKLIGWIGGSKGLRSAMKFLSTDIGVLVTKMKGLQLASLKTATFGFGPFLAGVGLIVAGIGMAAAKWREWTQEIKKNRLETIKASGFTEQFAEANANMIGEYESMRDKVRQLERSKQQLMKAGELEAWKGEEQLTRMRRDSENLLKGLAMQIKDMTKRELFLVNMGLNEKQVKKVMSDLGGRTMEVEAVKTDAAVQKSENAFMRFSEKFLNTFESANRTMGISVDVPDSPGAPPQPTLQPVMPPRVPGQDVEGQPIINVEPDRSGDEQVRLLERMVNQNEKQIDLTRRLLADIGRSRGARERATDRRPTGPMEMAMRNDNGIE